MVSKLHSYPGVQRFVDSKRRQQNETYHEGDSRIPNLLLKSLLFTKPNTVFTRASSLHIDRPLNHVFDSLLGFLILLWLCAVVCDILVEVTIANVTLDASVQAQGGSFLFACDNDIG